MMNDITTRENPISLEVSKDPEGILRLFVAGKLTNDRLSAFVSWTEKVKNSIREAAVEGESPILILTDISQVSHFERLLITPLRELFIYDSKFHIKSAIVGASQLLTALLGAVISIADRTNVKLFSSEKEALAWLRENENIKEDTPMPQTLP